MCNNNYNIKIVEGNEFALLFPLKARTYTANGQPVDADIDCTQLVDCKVIIGGVEYTPELGTDGVRVIMPSTLKRATYNAIITATYQSSAIKAAYYEAFTIVAWNSQSNAEQYVQGSPVVMPAAYVIGGTLTDAELVALKEQLVQAIADENAAKLAYEQAKADYDAKAEALDGIAQQATLTQGVADIREDISHIDIDTTDLAKEATTAKQGSDATISLTSMDAKLGDYVLIQQAEYAPALAALNARLN